MPKTLAEKQAWMRARQREKRQQPDDPEPLDLAECYKRRMLAGELNYLLESRNELDVQFLAAILQLRDVAAENHLDEPTLTLTGRGRGVRHFRYELKLGQAQGR